MEFKLKLKRVYTRRLIWKQYSRFRVRLVTRDFGTRFMAIQSNFLVLICNYFRLKFIKF